MAEPALSKSCSLHVRSFNASADRLMLPSRVLQCFSSGPASRGKINFGFGSRHVGLVSAIDVHKYRG